jgi:hypothetical protein
LRADREKDGEKYTEYLGLASLKFEIAGKTFGVTAIGLIPTIRANPLYFCMPFSTLP